MSKTEACWVPSYVASNMSDDEFVAMMRDCLPGPVVERICELESAVPQDAIDACAKATAALDAIGETFDKAGIDLDEPPDFGALTIAEAKALLDKFGDVAETVKGKLAEARDALEGVMP